MQGRNFMKKKLWTLAVVLSAVFLFPGAAPAVKARSVNPETEQAETMAKKKSAKLSKKVYRQIKGWWTNVSSGGTDRKFTWTKMKVYDRNTGECIGKMKIYGCKKVKGGYLIKLKNSRGEKLSYKFNKKADMMENYMGWKADGDYYSGSSSLFRGKWG